MSPALAERIRLGHEALTVLGAAFARAKDCPVLYEGSLRIEGRYAAGISGARDAS
jgi:hypothetical protein